MPEDMLPAAAYRRLMSINGMDGKWVRSMLRCLTDQTSRDVPRKPQELHGVNHWDIRKVLESRGDLSGHDVNELNAWRKWRNEVVDTEMRNANTLHGLLLLLPRVDVMRAEKVERHAESQFGRDVAELLREENVFRACRLHCLELHRCSSEWREPRWNGKGV